ncbi:hypothetical protein DER46DRAFT_657754 [Fusarium sp. MPI-SDFR-AT-0072]|nr:hypothetical protein DER46DRAFT_657754 [Fusarium sp. MPI-SDFR-AT-0072]
MAVTAQWSLDSTVSVALSISRGISRVATSNNIQLLALLTSEKFGATIPICHETCRKIETDVLPTNPPATIGFLKNSVGYSHNYNATQLGKSASDIQFLGSVAALVTTVGPFEAASALYVMQQNAAPDKTLLATTKQLSALLSALEVDTDFHTSIIT